MVNLNRYYSLNRYLKQTYGEKIYKISLNAGLTCPNRDGALGSRGCIFCSAGGSGDFAADVRLSVTEQIEQGRKKIAGKYSGSSYIAYFQAYTNTYAPPQRLRALYVQALEHPCVCGISIATRPDCLPEPVLHLLAKLRQTYPDKFIWIELGLQTVHENTAQFLRRGYKLPCFETAMRKLHMLKIPTIVHVILGLPGETPRQMLETIDYLNVWRPFGIKLQLLHVLEGTDLAVLYRAQTFAVLEKEEYLAVLVDCLTHLSPDIVIHRVTGDGPKKLLIAPLWSGNKRDVLNSLHQKMRLEGALKKKNYCCSIPSTPPPPPS